MNELYFTGVASFWTLFTFQQTIFNILHTTLTVLCKPNTELLYLHIYTEVCVTKPLNIESVECVSKKIRLKVVWLQ